MATVAKVKENNKTEKNFSPLALHMTDNRIEMIIQLCTVKIEYNFKINHSISHMS